MVAACLELIIFLLLNTAIGAIPQPEAINGFLDLGEWDFTENGLVSLKGEWDFFPGVFIPPGTFLRSPPEQHQSVFIPGMWGNPFSLSSPSGWKGFFTLHLKVRLKENERILFMKINQVALASKVWINEELVITNGTPGRNKQESRPSVRTMESAFRTDTAVFHITIHCANYWDRFGTLSRDLLLGQEKAIDQRSFLLRGQELASTVILLFSIFWLVLLYLLTRNRSICHLILFCVCIIIRCVLEGERIALLLFPSLPVSFIFTLLFGAYYAATFFFLRYVVGIVKEHFPAKSITGISFVCFLFLGSAFSGKIEFITTVGIAFHIVPFIILYFAFKAFRASGKRWVDTLAFQLGVLVIIGFLFNDVLHLFGITGKRYLAPHAVVVFIILQSYFLLKLGRDKPGLSKTNLETAFDALKLSAREKEVAVLMSEGQTTRQIAEKLYVSGNTAKFHIKRIYQKTGVNNRYQFLRLCFRMVRESTNADSKKT